MGPTADVQSRYRVVFQHYLIITNLISNHVFVEGSTFPFYRERTEVLAHYMMFKSTHLLPRNKGLNSGLPKTSCHFVL